MVTTVLQKVNECLDTDHARTKFPVRDVGLLKNCRRNVNRAGAWLLALSSSLANFLSAAVTSGVSVGSAYLTGYPYIAAYCHMICTRTQIVLYPSAMTY